MSLISLAVYKDEGGAIIRPESSNSIDFYIVAQGIVRLTSSTLSKTNLKPGDTFGELLSHCNSR